MKQNKKNKNNKNNKNEKMEKHTNKFFNKDKILYKI